MPKAKPPTDDLDLDQQAPGTPAPVAAPTTTVLTSSLNLTAEHVKNTPEYRELQRQNRILAREVGQAKAQAEQARTQAEAAAQAAEADRMAAQATRIRDLLGDDGVAMWDQFADLSTTDPVAAAELLAEFTKARAQSPAPVAPAAAAAPVTGGTQVAQQQTPPATGLSRTVGDAPLTGPADDTEEVIAALEKRYADTVERNQDPRQRNRVTMKDRANAMISYLGAAYLKAGAKPGSNNRP